MSIHLLEAAARMSVLPAAQKLVLLCLADSASSDNHIAWPGLEAIQAWAGVGRSTAFSHLSALEEAGLIQRVSSGARGRRAEFLVFPDGRCCGDHRRLFGSGTSDPLSESYPQKGSGTADPFGEKGPASRTLTAERVRKGSGKGPEATGPLPNSNLPTYVGRVSHQGAGQLEAHPLDPDFDPTRCDTHQGQPNPGPCGACGQARRHHEALEAQLARDAKATAAAHRKRAQEAALAAVSSCTLCDDAGIRGKRRCTHNAHEEARLDAEAQSKAASATAGAAKARAALRAETT